MVRGRPGPAPQTSKREQFGRLIARGFPNAEACRLVGVNRRTGTRWRFGREITNSSGEKLHYPAVTGYRWRAENGGVPPVRLAETARSNRYLSLLERQRIATLRANGIGVREIARRIGRAASTVSRELGRNLLRHDRDFYDADLAHARSRQRARRVRRTRLIRVPSYARWCSPSSSWSGARSRSPPTSGLRTRTGGTGTCATKRSTKGSTTAGRVA